MGKITGFMESDRELPKKREIEDRIKDYRELYIEFPEDKVKEQAGRCMDCGVPFCHTGCPLGISYRIGMTSCTAAIGATRWNDSTQQTTSRNLPDACVRPVRRGLRAGH